MGVDSSKNITGIVLMSDGLSEKLVSTQQDQVAGQITTWLQHLRHKKFKVNEFYQRLYSDDFLNKSVGDDRSIALYSTGLKN